MAFITTTATPFVSRLAGPALSARPFLTSAPVRRAGALSTSAAPARAAPTRMAITEGDSIPEHELTIVKPSGSFETVTTADLFSGTVAVCAIPGALTPTCQEQHLPSFIENVAALKAAGADKVVCLSVNDQFVMKVFGDVTGASKAGVIMVADGDASFVKKTGLVKETGAFGGTRSARYGMLVVGGKIAKLNVDVGAFEKSDAKTLLADLEDLKKGGDYDKLCSEDPSADECKVYDD